MTKGHTFLPEHFLPEMRSVEQSGHSCRLRQVDLGYNAKDREADVHSFILQMFFCSNVSSAKK